jgi:hypothetical protein
MNPDLEVTCFNVIYDIDSMACRFHNTMTGTLAIQLGSVIFPDPDWDDFIARTLTLWVNHARIVMEHSTPELFLFMDGSPRFTVSRRSLLVAEITCFEAPGFRGKAPSGSVDLIQFGETIHTAARKTENWARRNQCEREHIHALTDGMHALQDELKAMKNSTLGPKL